MKKTLIVLTILSLSAGVKAQYYYGYYIKFDAETIHGETKTGFVYLAAHYLNNDSLNNTDYLKKALSQRAIEWHKRDSLVYYKERIKYDYIPVDDSLGSKSTIYRLNNEQAIANNEIQAIKIRDMIEQSYFIQISNPLSAADTVWASKRPLRSYSFTGFVCYFQIFVHENSQNTNRIIKQLQEKQHKANEIDPNEIDEAFLNIIEELYGEKVVVVTECDY